MIKESSRSVYCLCRPPGHHAGKEKMGGYCYLNNAAIAATELKSERLAILDIDSHHGNGTQQVFYSDDSVLFCSIHGDPRTRYPFAWGYEDEIGRGDGRGFNLNIPLPESSRGAKWVESVEQGLERIRTFDPAYLIVSLGVDGLSEDSNGPFKLSVKDYAMAGRLISDTDCPTCIIQEGGYYLPLIGRCTRAFLENWV